VSSGRLRALAISAVLNEDEIKKRFTDIGARPIGSTPAEFASS
jgi:hypothetical protein